MSRHCQPKAKKADALGEELDKAIRKMKSAQGLHASGAQKDTVKIGRFGRPKVWTPPPSNS